jgi:hypothetical protein
MIVFNRLIPMSEGLKEIPQIMVGEASLNDAFIEQDGKWVFKPDVIATNPPPPKKPLPKKPLPQREYKKREYYTPVQ